MPDIPKPVMWAGGALLVLVILWWLAKALVPFAIGAICGAAAIHFWKD
jgi:hypothetical protein